MGDDSRVHREQSWRRAVLAGDEEAWRAWYDESYEPLRAFVLWRLARCPSIADEVLQETWLVAVRRIRDFDPQHGSFHDWLRGIAGNLIRNQMRHQQSTATTLKMIAETGETKGQSHAHLETAERAARVAAALLALPDHYAAVLRAKYLEQRSVMEIAEHWNQTVKAVESLLSRARLAFREQFGEDC